MEDYLKKENFSDLKIIIENPKGTYKSFEIEDDPVWKDYPLKGVTYPVDYGYIEGYEGEDGADLDIFVGTGDIYGSIKISRMDVPEETKFFAKVTEEELKSILEEFKPVILSSTVLSEEDFLEAIKLYKKL